jgi:hypothetical protein
MGYKHVSLQLKEVGFRRYSYSLSETNKDWKRGTLQVMKYVYCHSKYLLSVLNISLKLTCKNSEIRVFSLDQQTNSEVHEFETPLALSGLHI